jgi:lysophospholipase L1-like esterase
MTRHVILLSALFSLASCNMLKDTPSDPTPLPTNIVNYTAVGASDAIGYGSSIVCVPFIACPGGTGYIQIIERRLLSSGKTVDLTNLGIPGAVISSHVQAVGRAYGRDVAFNFISSELPVVARDSTVVTIFAGANDANTIGGGVLAGLGGSNINAFILAETQSFARDLKTLVSGIRDRAPQTKIVFLNLPNLAGLPYTSGYTAEQKRVFQQIAVAFSNEINAMASIGASVVDLMCDSAFYSPGLLSSDGFHPNDAGYAHLADIVYPAVTGTIGLPLGSCAQMTLY